jgi:translation initiation factor 3 subunit H
MAAVRALPSGAEHLTARQASEKLVSTQQVTALQQDTAPVSSLDRHLVASPYVEREHLLDLDTLDAENAYLSKALSLMECTRGDYATAPYLESFNWNEIMGELHRIVREDGHKWKETSFFVVVFRSQIPPTTVYADLGVLDKAAHAEGMASGGFLK